MTKYWMALAASLFVIGCGDDKDTASDDLDTDDTTVADDVDFAINWNGNDVSLNIANGSGTYFFGMAETTCGDPANCWTGEDCYLGFADYAFCHPADATGVALTHVDTLDAIVDGSTTILEADLHITYYVEDSADCWIWGDDVTYYAGLGCTEL